MKCLQKLYNNSIFKKHYFLQVMKKFIYSKYIVCIFTIILNVDHYGYAQTMYPTSGTEFMFCIPDHRPSSGQWNKPLSKLTLSSLYNTVAEISCPAIGYLQTVKIHKNSAVEVILPDDAVPSGFEVALDTTIEIRSQKPISVILRRQEHLKAAGYMNILPIEACGEKYRVIGFRNDIGSNSKDNPNIVAITAFCDSTQIKISVTDTSHTGLIAPSPPKYIQLDKGESYIFRTPNIFDQVPFKTGDFTGTLIETLDSLNKKIAVTVHDFEGVGQTSAWDYMYEMLAPNRIADTLFFDFTSKHHQSHCYRVIPIQNNTQIWVNGQLQGSRNSFEFYQFYDSTNVKIRTDKPVQVYRFLRTNDDVLQGDLGDPELTRIEPCLTGITKSVIRPEAKETTTYINSADSIVHYVQIICRSGNEKDFKLNQQLLSDSFKPFLADTNWVYAEFLIDSNIHIAEASKPFLGFYGVSVIQGSLVHNLAGRSDYDNFYAFYADTSTTSRINVFACEYPFELSAPLVTDDVLWWNGSTLPVQKIYDPGTYWVRQKVIGKCGESLFYTDTIDVQLDDITYQVKKGKDVCLDDSLEVEISGNFNQIEWDDLVLTKKRFIKPNYWYKYGLQLHRCVAVDSIQTTSLPAPKTTLPPDFSSCDTGFGEINLSNYNIGVSDSAAWQPRSYFRYQSKNTYRVDSKKSFTAYLNTVNYSGCTSIDTVNFINSTLSDSLTVVGDYDCTSGLLTLELENPEEVQDIYWDINNQTTLGDAIEVSNFSTSELTGKLHFKYGLGCTGTQSFRYQVGDYQIGELSNVFTPNSDGINDLFHPIGNKYNRPCYHFEAYSRWGKKVFSSSPERNSWDGKINGKDATPGVYFFILDINGKKQTGHFTLIR